MLAFASLILPASTYSANNSTEDIDLPTLNQGGSALMTTAQEYSLGQTWLRSFRAAAPIDDDPVVFEYVENLLLSLASHSELDNRNLDLVMVSNPTINAFAVPGGVVGVHTGLLQNAQTEAQFASVLAHELAHLSQRHFVRGIEAAKRSSLATFSGMLAGLVLAAAGEGDAATAAIASSQAAALESRLRYSRLHEREADRIGMKTLHHSGYASAEAANMFKQMQNVARLYGNKTPEFLLTHPVTESRIADAENRARQIGEIGAVDSIEYQRIKARGFVNQQANPKQAIQHFQFILQNPALASSNQPALFAQQPNRAQSFAAEAARYGLTLAYLKAEQWQLARETLAPLIKKTPPRIIYSLADIRIDLAAGLNKRAVKRLQNLYALTPNNYAIGMLLGKTLMQSKKYSAASNVLQTLATAKPKQADIWYLLAEAQGFANEILGLHRSRAEFFLLHAQYAQAMRHLEMALKLAGNDYQVTAMIKQRLRNVAVMRQNAKNMS